MPRKTTAKKTIITQLLGAESIAPGEQTLHALTSNGGVYAYGGADWWIRLSPITRRNTITDLEFEENEDEDEDEDELEDE